MFNVGSTEFMLIGAIAVVVIGPKELPAIMYNLGRAMRRVQYIKYAFTQQFEDFLREHDLHDMNQNVNFEQKHLKDAEFDESAADEQEFGVIDNEAVQDGEDKP